MLLFDKDLDLGKKTLQLTCQLVLFQLQVPTKKCEQKPLKTLENSNKILQKTVNIDVCLGK